MIEFSYPTASDSFRGGHLTHPDSAADGGPLHAQMGAREGLIRATDSGSGDRRFESFLASHYPPIQKLIACGA